MSFYIDVIQKHPSFTDSSRVSDIELLEPITRAAVLNLIAAAKLEGIELMVFETYRSQVRQQQLFDKKASQLQKVGVHGYGLACDLVKNLNGQPSWHGDFMFLGPLAKRFGLIWGGDWGTPGQHHTLLDFDHVQRCSVPKQNGLFAGTWYPDVDYDPYQL